MWEIEHKKGYIYIYQIKENGRKNYIATFEYSLSLYHSLKTLVLNHNDNIFALG